MYTHSSCSHGFATATRSSRKNCRDWNKRKSCAKVRLVLFWGLVACRSPTPFLRASVIEREAKRMKHDRHGFYRHLMANSNAAHEAAVQASLSASVTPQSALSPATSKAA